MAQVDGKYKSGQKWTKNGQIMAQVRWQNLKWTKVDKKWTNAEKVDKSGQMLAKDLARSKTGRFG